MPAHDYSDLIDPNQYTGTYARFYIHPAIDGDASLREKKNIYKDILYVEITEKGNSNMSFSRPKKPEDEQVFPKEWKAYETGNSLQSGTALNFLPNIGPSEQMNLNQQGITSIEDLAELSDSIVSNQKGLFELRRRAKAYVAAMEVEEAEETRAIVTEIKRTRRKRNPETGELE